MSTTDSMCRDKKLWSILKQIIRESKGEEEHICTAILPRGGTRQHVCRAWRSAKQFAESLNGGALGKHVTPSAQVTAAGSLPRVHVRRERGSRQSRCLPSAFVGRELLSANRPSSPRGFICRRSGPRPIKILPTACLCRE